MTGIGPEFLKILEGIDWDSLDAKSATLLRAALKTALVRSDEWFAALARDFGGGVPAKVASGRPPEEVVPPREPKTVPTAGVGVALPKRKRGRPPKAKAARPTATPLAVGGADAESQEGPQPARIFENSYVSKDGPRADIPSTLPANHPRRGALTRDSSVTPDVDMSDFATVENAMRTGKGLKGVFQ
jgi:hypothetical protein